MPKHVGFFKNEEESFDLDMAPVLSLVVALVPILLATAVFVRIGVIDTQLPQIIHEAVQQEQKNESPKVTVKLEVDSTQGLVIELNNEGHIVRKKIELTQNDFNYESLHNELVEIKKQFPMVFRLELRPTEDVPYEKIIKIMDHARMTKPTDPKLFVIDPKTNKKIESPYMFVDIYFGNVVES